MLAGGLWRDHRFGAAFGEPGAQAARVVGTIGEQPRRAWHDREQRPGAIEIVGVASGKLEGEGPPLIVAQGMDLGRPPAARAADGMTEGPPFAPAAERCALMCVESIATVPTIPVEPVRA
jgi:hypothetical protein